MVNTKNSIAVFSLLTASLFTSSNFGMDTAKSLAKDAFSLKTLGFASAVAFANISYEDLYSRIAKKISPKYYDDIDDKTKQYEAEMSTKINSLDTDQGFIDVAKELAKRIAKELIQISAPLIIPAAFVAAAARAGTPPKITLLELAKATGCTCAAMGATSLLAGLGNYWINKNKTIDPRYAAVKFANKTSYYTNLFFMAAALPAYLVYKLLHQ